MKLTNEDRNIVRINLWKNILSFGSDFYEIEYNQKKPYLDLFITDRKIKYLLSFSKRNNIKVSDIIKRKHLSKVSDGTICDSTYSYSLKRYINLIKSEGDIFRKVLIDDFCDFILKRGKLKYEKININDVYDYEKITFWRSNIQIFFDNYQFDNQKLLIFNKSISQWDKNLKLRLKNYKNIIGYADVDLAFWLPKRFWWEHVIDNRGRRSLYNNGKLDIREYKRRFDKAIKHSYILASKCVKDKLPASFLFRLNKKSNNFLDSEQVLKKIINKNKIPVWVDLCVERVVNDSTIIRVAFNPDRFVDKSQLIYDFDRKFPPFASRAPWFPAKFLTFKKNNQPTYF